MMPHASRQRRRSGRTDPVLLSRKALRLHPLPQGGLGRFHRTFPVHFAITVSVSTMPKALPCWCGWHGSSPATKVISTAPWPITGWYGLLLEDRWLLDAIGPDWYRRVAGLRHRDPTLATRPPGSDTGRRLCVGPPDSEQQSDTARPGRTADHQRQSEHGSSILC